MPNIAAAPIPNADHEKPLAELAVADTGDTVQLPRWYFLFKAWLRSTSARYSAAVMPCGTRLYVPRWYCLFSPSLRSVSARYSALLIRSGLELDAWTGAASARATPIVPTMAPILYVVHEIFT